MRGLLACLIVVGSLGAAAPIATPALAQSAYDYPWCSVRADHWGTMTCYFSTYRQCMETISGIGGSCIRSPYYRGPQPRPSRRYERR